MRRTWLLAVAVLVAVAVLAVAVAVHGAVVGRTLASGQDWRIVARWGVPSHRVTTHDPSGSVSSGPLARGGTLAETTIHPTPDGSTYVIGVLPTDARTVRVTGRDGTVADTRLERVVTARFYVAVLDRRPDALRLEALDEQGNVPEEMQLA